MKVSVIIPIYGVEKYISDCLNSVMKQSYTNDIECILINDCTKDQSIEIAKNLIENYDGNINFKIYEHSVNGGLSAARNTGVKYASGDYLYFLDSDDSITPNCLEDLVKTANLYPKADIVQAGAITNATEEFHYLSMENNDRLPLYSENHKLIKWRMLWTYYPATAWNKLIKRRWFIDNNLFFKEGLLHEDDYWTFFASKYVTAYAICKKDTYLYNIRPGSITQAPNEHNIQSWIKSLSDFVNSIDDDCQAAQRSLIYRLAITYMLRSGKYYITNYIEILKKLLPFCNLIGRMIVLEAIKSVPKECALSKKNIIRIKILSRFV